MLEENRGVFAKFQRQKDLLILTENPIAIKEILGGFDNIDLQIFHSKKKKKLQLKPKEKSQTEDSNNNLIRNEQMTK